MVNVIEAIMGLVLAAKLLSNGNGNGNGNGVVDDVFDLPPVVTEEEREELPEPTKNAIEIFEVSLRRAQRPLAATAGHLNLPDAYIRIRNVHQNPLSIKVFVQYQMDDLTIVDSVNDIYAELNYGQIHVINLESDIAVPREQYPVHVGVQVTDQTSEAIYSDVVTTTWVAPLLPTITMTKKEIQQVGSPEGKAGITSMDQVPDDDGTGYFMCFYRTGNPTDIGCSKKDRAGLEELINSPAHVVFDVVRLSEWEARKELT